MNEAEFEYLLNTLSDARSRAAELAVAVRTRVGEDHRLSELGNAALSQIETVLRDARNIALEERDSVKGKRPESGAQPSPPSNMAARNLDAADDTSRHWFPDFVNELLQRYRTSGGITFEIVEQVLKKHKEAFAKELDITRKMYRAYPHLFQDVRPPTV